VKRPKITRILSFLIIKAHTTLTKHSERIYSALYGGELSSVFFLTRILLWDFLVRKKNSKLWPTSKWLRNHSNALIWCFLHKYITFEFNSKEKQIFSISMAGSLQSHPSLIKIFSMGQKEKYIYNHQIPTRWAPMDCLWKGH